MSTSTAAARAHPIAAAPRPSYLLWTPALRSAHLERLTGPGGPPPAWRFAVAATGRHADCDDDLLAGAPVAVQLSDLDDLVRRVAAGPPSVLEVTEPLWRAEWPSAQRLIAAAAGRSRVVTYAIDELVGRRPVPDAGVLAAVAFGTRAAARAYAAAYPGAAWTAAVIEERRTRCPRCFPTGRAAPARREVVLAAELSARKGVDLLLAAWDALGRAGSTAGWRLRLLGWGPLRERARAWAAGRDDAEVTGPVDRSQLHAALRRAAVVVLPSRRVPGWREQVGLSLVEGLAHGCHLVTTTETGLAEGLAEEGHTVVGPDDLEALTLGLRVALTAYRPEKVLPPDGTDSRMRATHWLARAGG